MIITEVFHFYATCSIFPFLFRKFFKTLGELVHLLTLHPKLFFRGALKKALVVPEDAKIFPCPLASTLHDHFYVHLKESSENAL